ncbi:MAG: MBOAT family protein [Anaerolineae bacterium]|nr:MBOAT family protein [Anaerolineae bacterium]
MPFNSFQFLLFLPAVLVAYLRIPQRYRWALLLTASYGFYAAWSPSFLIWIALSTLMSYVLARLMAQTSKQRWRKGLLVSSIVAHLSLLFAFKYLNFASDIWRALVGQAPNVGAPVVNLLLPVGISFYTFQSIGYTIDVYRGRIAPEKHLGIFALYVSFFPKLVAGPIERAEHLLPQFRLEHTVDASRVFSGLQLVLWGMFKKVVIADRLAVYVNAVYTHPLDYAGWTIVAATLFCAAQIYSDFSGYSDMAVGVARMFGFELIENFRQPYCASSVSEFWRRWHISLSSWFRDYLYIPLGGNRVPRWRWYLNLFVVFLASGLWHGANWTFVIWGALHGIYIVLEVWSKKARDAVARRLHIERTAVRTILSTTTTFILVTLAWVFFQARSVSYALLLLRNLFRFDVASDIYEPWAGLTNALGLEMVLAWGLIGLLALVHLDRDGRLPLSAFVVKTPWIRWIAYLLLALAIMNLGVANETPFIYAGF